MFGEEKPSPGPWPVRWDGKQVGELDAEGITRITDPAILEIVRELDPK